MSEDDFQAMLDANPDDWQTRLVLADWLQDRDDPRAEGYRALGVLGRRCWVDKDMFRWTHWGESSDPSLWMVSGSTACLPWDWHSLLFSFSISWRGVYWSREYADDAAAAAFAMLPEDRRAELLQGVAA